MSEPTVSKLPHRLRDERGFMLIEVLVSAVILVTASLAIFATLSSADSAAGQQQVRVEAANFAQSELERIRSLPVEDVMDFASAGTRTVSRNGIPFKENVVAKWVSDGGDEPKCSGQEGGLDYMRTTVTISWPGMGKLLPVSLTSLFTPNAGAGGTTGSLSVHITGADGSDQPGVGVTIDGEGAGGHYSGTTNVNGCVVFGFIPQDTYDLIGAKNGYVDQDSNPQIKDSPQVTAAETTKEEYSYDQAGQTSASFQTTFVNGLLGTVAGLTLPNTVPTYPQHLQVWHAQQTYPGGFDQDLTTNLINSAPLTYNPTNASDPNRFIYLYNSNPSVNATNTWDARTAGVGLYPFTSPYTIYAGQCPANATQGSAAKFVNVIKNQYTNAGTVSVPALQVKVMSGSNALQPGSPIGGARVMVNSGCGDWVRYTATSNATAAGVSSNATTGAGGRIDNGWGQSNWGVGTLGDPGFPYTTLAKVCAYDPASRNYSAITSTANTNTSVGTLVTLYMNVTSGTPIKTPQTGTTAGNCQA